MPQPYDITILFTFPPVKVIFEEIFLKTVFNSKLKILTKNGKKESNYKDLVYSEKWMSLIISEPYYNNSRKWRRGEDIQELINAFFDFLSKYPTLLETPFLLKIIVPFKGKKSLIFLFDESKNQTLFKLRVKKAVEKVSLLKKRDTALLGQIKKTYKQKSQKIYFTFRDNDWHIVDILFNAGQYHNEAILNGLTELRRYKKDVWLHEGHFSKTVSYEPLWALKVNNKHYVRTQPNDIALYSSIAMKQLEIAKRMFDDEQSVLWRIFPLKNDESFLFDYYEHIVVSITLSYTSIEALINIAIPGNYIYKRREKNKVTNRYRIVRYNKELIERWFTLYDKINAVLPDALGISPMKQEKWWPQFDLLEKLRNKIIHSIESKSNERYSELLNKNVFKIIQSHISVIKFVGKWATENKHYLLNSLPYGFGYDSIKPALIDEDTYRHAHGY